MPGTSIDDIFLHHAPALKKVLYGLLGRPSPKALSALTGTSEDKWISDYSYDLPPSFLSGKISISAVIDAAEGAKAVFSGLVCNEDSGIFNVLRLSASGRRLESLRFLLDFITLKQGVLGPEAFNLSVILLMRALLGHPLDVSNTEEALAFLHICKGAFPLLVGCGCHIPAPAVLFYRARGTARIIGDSQLAAFFDLLIGATNICNHSRHGNLRCHRAMGNGIAFLSEHGSTDVLLDASPYFGIWHFMEGRYELAMEAFKIGQAQLHRDGKTLMELFCLRHWVFSAFNRGMYGFVEQQLQSRLRELLPRSDAQLARTLRGQLAGCLLRSGKLDEALVHLETAQSGLSSQHDIVSFITNSRQLAYYHLLRGNIRKAHQIFGAAMTAAEDLGYRTPLYLSCVVLELLQAFRDNGFPPIPGYDLDFETERCILGPNRILQGIGYRILGDSHLKRNQFAEAEACFEKSLERLKGVSIQEMNKTQLRLASLFLRTGNTDKASFMAASAWQHHGSMKFFWNRELREAVPKFLRRYTEARLDRGKLISRYADRMAGIPPNEDGRAFALTLVMASCHALEASYGLLFHMKDAWARPVLISAISPAGPWTPEAGTLPYWDFERLVQNGYPQVGDLPESPEGAGKSTLGAAIPISASNGGTFILCHYVFNNPDIRFLINSETLQAIGRSAGEVLSKHRIGNLSPEKKRGSPAREGGASQFICVSPAMTDILRRISSVADTDTPVLITGESGTGKEMVARRLHEASGRTGRLVSLNMAGLSEDLVANELFGHEKGSYTGAQLSHDGLIAQAANGTLFLDEITEAPPRVQGALLRVLESMQYYRIGGTQPIRTNFRLVAASNRDMRDAVRSGVFRKDLYYRISGIILKLPPLRERPEDIPALAYYYLHYFANRHGRDVVTRFSEEEAGRLAAYPWPGNIRELRNTIERSVLLSGCRTIAFDESGLDQPDDVETMHRPCGGSCGPTDRKSPSAGGLPEIRDYPSMKELEKRYIESVMAHSGGNVSDAMKILRIGRSTLYAKLKEYGMSSSPS